MTSTAATQLDHTDGRPGDDEARWDAVQRRDRARDGAFVYAVRSTGVYCRPSCPSRRPARAGVRFFTRPTEAERAGFRACRRCRPRDAGGARGVAEPSPRVALVRRACESIARGVTQIVRRPPTLAELGAELGVSPHHLQRTFKQVMGVSPRQYAEACRLGGTKTSLREESTVGRAVFEAGFGSSSRLYERAPAQLGMTPGAYRRGGAGVRVRYTVADSPLGRLIVAGTERGVCAVSLGDTDDALVGRLRAEYPAAELSRDDAALGAWVATIVRHLRGEEPHLDLPLDVRATAFQWRVWQALRAIPYGSTASYSGVARDIGHPTAARAVARACATNPVPLLVPCHRVVREDGGLGGYALGLERKVALLQTEKERAG